MKIFKNITEKARRTAETVDRGSQRLSAALQIADSFGLKKPLVEAMQRNFGGFGQVDEAILKKTIQQYERIYPDKRAYEVLFFLK